MGTTLFSCADKNGNKQKIDAVEVVKDTTTSTQITVGMMLPEKNNTQNHVQPPGPATKVNHVKFINPQTNACEETTKNETVVEDVIYNGGISFEFPAEYKGGIEKFYAFFKEEFKHPENIKYKITEISISFVIDKDGSLTYVKPKSEIDLALENEIIRVLKLCPRWKPGEQNGKKTRTLYSESISLI